MKYTFEQEHMRFKKEIIIVLIVLAIVLFGVRWAVTKKISQIEQTPPTGQQMEGKQASATIELFSKPVFVVLPQATSQSEAVEGQEIPVGTKIITGENGRAQLVFPNKSVTRLDTKTQITLKKLTTNPFQVEITLEKRRIWSRVARLLGKEEFSTATNTVVATVRGTSYGIGILPDGRNRVISRRGLIDTKCVNDSQEAEVVPDKKILLDCTIGGKLPLLELDEQIKDKDEWYFFNEQEDTKLDDRFGKDVYADEN